jgi:hypothetical protein
MARPIKKSRMSNLNLGPAGTAGKIEVTAYYPVGGSLQQDDNSFVISQRSSRKYKIHQQNDSSDQVLQLRAVAPAYLTAGQFCVKVLLGDSTVAYVEKFYNGTIHYRVGATTYTNGTTGWVKYSLGNAVNENVAISGSGVIDVI